ncbi:MAG: efflux RND transporter periplasmic adaptor subunit [Acidobacteriaceae bacterium]
MKSLNLALAASSLALCVAGCSSNSASTAPPPASRTIVQTVVVHSQKVIDQISIPARVVANPTKVVQVFPPLSGRLVRFSVLPGQTVQAGQVIAVLQSGDIAQARSDFEKAKIQVLLADQALTRGKLLLQHEVLAKADYEQLVAADDAAHSEQERARQLIHELGFSEDNNSDQAPIRAPISGVVLDTGTAVGEWQRSLDNATPLATIANLDHVWILGDAYQNDLASIHVGRPVTVNFPAYPGLSLSGKVDNLSQALDPTTLAVKVRVVLANPQMKLKPQMFANILVDRSSTEGFLVPSAAVVHENNFDSVFVQTSPGNYERRPVKIGEMQQQNVVVLSGLHDGDQVVALGAALLRAPAGE